MNPRHDSQIRLSNETPVRLPLYLLVSLLVVVASGVMAWANLNSEVKKIPAIETRMEAHEVALGEIKVMANDIRWIKRNLSEPRATTRITQDREP